MHSSRWYAYHLPPIDYGWECLRTVEQTVKILGQREALQKLSGWRDEYPTDEFISAWERAQREAKSRGWEGDFRHDPVVFWIPGETGFMFAFAFKQDNNGSTFVISPVMLPWLEELDTL